MAKLYRFIPFLIFVFFYSCEDPSSPLSPEREDLQTNLSKGNTSRGYIVVFSENISRVPEEAADIAQANTATITAIYQNTIKGFAANMSFQSARRLASDPRVKYIEQDKVVTLAPPSEKPGKPGNGGGGEENPSVQEIPWGVTRVGGPGDGTGKRAFVIDTGIDANHADLNLDQTLSANFVTSGKDSYTDGNGHGTHVAGTIAALDNDLDVVGVAAGASVVAVRVLDNRGSGYYSWVIAGIDYVASVAQNGDVANMSLGGPASQALDDAIIAAASQGVKFSLAAGNEAQNANNVSPARVNHTNVFTVSAIDSGDKFAYFSNFGNPPVDYAAPGVGILSTKKGGGTVSYNGTSMAAPHVAGLLLLGNIQSDGFAQGDPDGIPDRIAHN